MSGLGVLAGTPRALPGHSQGTSRALPGHSHPHNCPRGREQLREVSTCSLPPSLPPSHCTGVTKMDSHNIKALSSILCVRLSTIHARYPFCTGSCCGRGRFNPAERTSSKDCMLLMSRICSLSHCLDKGFPISELLALALWASRPKVSAQKCCWHSRTSLIHVALVNANSCPW